MDVETRDLDPGQIDHHLESRIFRAELHQNSDRDSKRDQRSDQCNPAGSILLLGLEEQKDQNPEQGEEGDQSKGLQKKIHSASSS